MNNKEIKDEILEKVAGGCYVEYKCNSCGETLSKLEEKCPKCGSTNIVAEVLSGNDGHEGYFKPTDEAKEKLFHMFGHGVCPYCGKTFGM